jgi:hypothetical protein
MSYYRVMKDREFVQEFTDSNEVVQYILAHPDADIRVGWRKREWMRYSTRIWDAQEFMSIFGESHLSIDSQ